LGGAFVLAGLGVAGTSHAVVDPKCAGLPKPSDYNELVQQDFLLNYFALSSTFSPLHAPIPHEPGHGSFGVDFNGIPPLSCRKRFALEWTKTEETNKSPVVPQLVASYAFPAIREVIVPYASVAYMPPVPLLGTRNVILSAEAGVGIEISEKVQVGARFHATVMRTIADVATPFEEGDPIYDDLYLGSTFGFDVMGGLSLGNVTPYMSMGFVDVSTFFWIGDDSVVSNNYHPYLGPAWSLGADGLFWERFRVAGEYYGAMGGFRRLDPDLTVGGPVGRYGSIHTLRVRLGVEL